MKNLRLWFSLVVLLLTVGFGSISPLVSADEGGAKCDCRQIFTGSYGVKSGTDCIVQDCWIPLE